MTKMPQDKDEPLESKQSPYRRRERIKKAMADIKDAEGSFKSLMQIREKLEHTFIEIMEEKTKKSGNSSS